MQSMNLFEIPSFTIEDKYLYFGKNVTKGTQVKYKKDNIYYKLDENGREGFVEFLVSEILNCSDLDKNLFVKYSVCKVNDRMACCSKSFLNANEEFFTMNAIYKILTGNSDLADYLASLSEAKARLQYLCETIANFGFNKDEFYLYLNRLLQLDYLIENTDRHPHNFGLIINNVTGSCRIAPIFDNGRALHTVDETYCSCTISGSFGDQITAFNFPVIPAFRIDYDKAFNFLKAATLDFGKRKETEFLIKQLEVNEDLFRL